MASGFFSSILPLIFVLWCFRKRKTKRTKSPFKPIKLKHFFLDSSVELRYYIALRSNLQRLTDPKLESVWRYVQNPKNCRSVYEKPLSHAKIQIQQKYIYKIVHCSLVYLASFPHGNLTRQTYVFMQTIRINKKKQ